VLSLRFLQLGWVIAAAFLAVALAGGFQGPTEKVGVVNIAKVVEQSDYGKANQQVFNKMKAVREGFLEFVDTYRVLTAEQAQRLHDLVMKPSLSKEEQAEMDRIKADIVASSKRSTELATKPNLTPEERTLVEEYARRSQGINDQATRWLREFTTEMQTWLDKEKLDSIEKARVAIQQVAREQGFTVVFEVGVAPYGANDISDATLKAMNGLK
jgi:Skp family chaperone for outer membrane proteins